MDSEQKIRLKEISMLINNIEFNCNCILNTLGMINSAIKEIKSNNTDNSSENVPQLIEETASVSSHSIQEEQLKKTKEKECFLDNLKSMDITNDQLAFDDEEAIMRRRIELHKQMGTYKEPKQFNVKEDQEIKKELEHELEHEINILTKSKESIKESKIHDDNIIQGDLPKPVQNEAGIPKITPLSKLSKKNQDILLKQLFNEAKFNVENLLNIKNSDPEFVTEVCKESDRLLDVWMQKH